MSGICPKVLAGGSSLLLGALALHALHLLIHATPGLGLLLAMFAAAVAMAGLVWYLSVTPGLTTRLLLTLAMATFVVSRMLAVQWIPSRPESDFGNYYRFSQQLATWSPLPEVDPRAYMFAWGYPLILAPVGTLCGFTLPLMQGVSVLCGAVSLLLIWRFARSRGAAPARAAAILFVFWPAQMFFTPVLASEHLALPLCLGALSCTLYVRVPLKAGAGWALLGGLTLASAIAVRPALGVVLPVSLVMIGLIRADARRRLTLGVLFLVAFCAGQLAYRVFLQTTYRTIPTTAATWNLMVGLNHESGGLWNEADAAAYFGQPSFSEAEHFARDEIVRRLQVGPRKLLRLAMAKIARLWADGQYGVRWSTLWLRGGSNESWIREQESLWCTWSQLFQAGLLAAAAIGAGHAAIRSPTRTDLLAILLILAGTALHTLFESQPRYQHVFAVGLLILAATAISRTKANVRIEIGNHSARPGTP